MVRDECRMIESFVSALCKKKRCCSNKHASHTLAEYCQCVRYIIAVTHVHSQRAMLQPPLLPNSHFTFLAFLHHPGASVQPSKPQHTTAPIRSVAAQSTHSLSLSHSPAAQACDRPLSQTCILDTKGSVFPVTPIASCCGEDEGLEKVGSCTGSCGGA